MGTFGIIICLLVGFFLLKFIYDTYLTNNTENRFEEYRKSDPIGAAEIEKPKTREQVVDLVHAIDNELSREQPRRSVKNIIDLYPNFYQYYKNQKDSLQLEIVRNDSEYFEFRMPIITYDKIRGYNFFGICQAQGFYILYVKCTPQNGEEFHGDLIKIPTDLPISEYNRKIDEMSMSLVENPKYMEMYFDSED